MTNEGANPVDGRPIGLQCRTGLGLKSSFHIEKKAQTRKKLEYIVLRCQRKAVHF